MTALQGYIYYRVLATSTYEDITLEFVKNNLGCYYLKYMHTFVTFKVPNVNQVLGIRDGSTVTPNCFILFRREVRLCISSIGLRIGRAALSRHMSNIWQELRINEPDLVDSFRDVANNAARIFNDQRLRIRIIDGSHL
ncbi:13929_t:CDS:1 [Dentiscutata erythropus]|uniref:13929_t:CDS:1 n=1 Tax=Dentiscutata erythropus TaxID=1348616 RepID=A0A9N8VKV9_9GLOM|nr:13929_t:CDS:1 [Dentiscutata erythropus]